MGVHNPSTSSVAAFFANACEQEQKEQEQANGSEFQPPSIKPPDSRHNVSTMHQHPPSGVVTGGPPGIGLTLQNTAAPMPGIVPILPGGIPGMALLPQPPGAPPIMVPIMPPSTGAHLFNQQQQIRLAVAHAQAAAAAQQSVRPQGVPGNINGLPGVGITNIAEAFDQISAPGGKKSGTTSPSIPALQDLLENPAAMSVESLERAHREESRTPPATSSKATNSKRPTNLESDLKSKLNINELNSGGKQNKTEHKANSNKHPASEGGNKPSYAGAAKSPNKRISQKGRQDGLESQNKIESVANTTPNSKHHLNRESLETEEVQLLSPQVFSQPLNGHISTSMDKNKSILDENQGEITPLTKGQLSQALQHLLKTDPSFVGRLHTAYVESLNNKLN